MRALLAAALAAIAATAHAQPSGSSPGQAAPTAADDAIVVEGRRMPREAIERAATELVRGTLVMPEDGQYARWNGPVCAKVAGIADAYAGMVLRRFSAAATEAGVKLAPAGCDGNLFIVFAQDGKQMAATVARQVPVRLFSSTTPQQKRELMDGELPIRWMYFTMAGGTDNSAVTNGMDAASSIASMSVGAGPDGQMGFGDAQTTTRYSSSMIDTNNIVSIRGALVIVDLSRAEGYPLASVANYAARVALAQTKMPPRGGDVPSILNLFGDSDAKTHVTELSDWDRAFLKALYKIIPNRAGWTQRNRIQGEIVRALAARNAPPATP